jgi:signal transduction histidine kinase
VVREGSPEPASLQDLAGSSILVMAGDLMDDLAREQGYGSQLVTMASQEEALRRLAGGEHDCALVAKVPALYWIKKNGWRNLKVVDHTVVSAECCYAVPRGKDDLLAQLTEGLAAVKATGEYRKIQSRWIEPYEPSRPGLQTIAKYVLLGTLPLLALLIGSFLWSRSLQKQVAGRTLELTREITKRHAAQEELRHSQKMEAIALLAGGVAHNFNNILQGISAQIGLMQIELAGRDRSRARLDRMTAEIQRAARLTEQLVTFSRQQRDSTARLDLSRAICEARERLRAIVGTGIDLEVSCANTPLWVDIDQHQLDLVLDNLAVNAREAMQEGGSLTVTVQPGEVETTPALADDNGDTGPYASLTVSDTGTGMDEATMQRAFEPFFSTKGMGSGTATGMGLAIAHAIVTQHNGRIQVDSAPGQGSTFRILLPRVDPEAAAPSPDASTGHTTSSTD